MTSEDVNTYLLEIAGEEISAKDFRTWAGTVLAAVALSEFEAVDSETAAKRNIRRAIEMVATRLGNTPTVCRKCYVHPEIFQCYLEGRIARMLKSKIEKELACRLGKLSAAEAATLALLHSRLSTLKAGPIVNNQKVLRKTSSSDSRIIFDKTNYSQRGNPH